MMEKIKTIFLILNYKCNAKCEYCYRQDSISHYSELSSEDVKNIIDTLFKFTKIKEVILSGGEPLLNKEIFEIVKLFEKKGVRIHFSTNGTLPHITEKLLKSVKKDLYFFSINYFISPINLRKNQEETIKILKSAKIKFGFKLIVHKENYLAIPSIIKEIWDKYDKDAKIILLRFLPMVDKKTNQRFFLEHHRVNFLEAKLLEELKDHLHKIDFSRLDLDHFCPAKSGERVVIDPEGNVELCIFNLVSFKPFYDVRKKKIIGDFYKIYNSLKLSFENFANKNPGVTSCPIFNYLFNKYAITES